MPAPVPTPTPAEIVKVAEITLLSVDTVSTMIAADSDADISNAKWTLTLADITAWDAGIRNETGEIKKVGSIEFFEGTAPKTRLDFRNRVRARYGQTFLTGEYASGTQNRSSSVPIQIEW